VTRLEPLLLLLPLPLSLLLPLLALLVPVVLLLVFLRLLLLPLVVVVLVAGCYGDGRGGVGPFRWWMSVAVVMGVVVAVRVNTGPVYRRCLFC
jgi:hypothetical protein